MSFILTLISLVIIYMGAMLIYRPKAIPDLVKLYVEETWLQVFASVGRILIGVALTVYADHSRLPVIMTILGAASILSGIAFMFMSPEKFSSFLNDMLNKAEEFGIWPGVVVTIIGLLILYAVW
ncbi:MAG: hypothetical protein R3F02_06805 [Thiolinea sp.]